MNAAAPGERLHEVLGAIELDRGAASARVELPASWLQGRTIFGGLAGALLEHCMLGCLPSPREPRSLQVAFVAPVVPGPLEVGVETLRAGRRITYLAARLVQDGSVRATAQGTFGAGNPGRLSVPGLAAPEAPRPDALPTMPVAPLLPAFVQHFEMRFSTTRMPFSGDDGRDLGGWCRPRDAVCPADPATLAAITDAWPGSVLPNLRAPAPASTVSWTMDFAPGLEPSRADAWWQYAALTEAAGDGYALSRAYLWDEDGRLAVASRQVLAVFEASPRG